MKIIPERNRRMYKSHSKNEKTVRVLTNDVYDIMLMLLQQDRRGSRL
jgi:hypothetical protein